MVLLDEDKMWANRFLRHNGIGEDGNDLIIGIVPGGGTSWSEDAVYNQWPDRDVRSGKEAGFIGEGDNKTSQ